MKIYLEREDKDINIKFKGTVLDLLKYLKINQYTVVVDVNGKIVENNVLVFDNDNIRILDVVTGG